MIGGIPVSLFAKEGPLASSQHFGGTLPMSLNPMKYQTDIHGRPFGSKNVYVVDTSVLTTIPGTPTTYTTMANAVRICEKIANL